MQSDTVSGVKEEERIAAQFLKNRFGVDPTFEPLGQYKPPDFAIGATAFEVRRLNQHYFGEDGEAEALEELYYRLKPAIEGTLDKVPYSEGKGSYFWLLSFARPIKIEFRDVVQDLTRQARAHYDTGNQEIKSFESQAVRLELRPASASCEKAFRYGCDFDLDGGGCFGDIYPTNICLTLKEKIGKTAEIASKFERWVLVLVDYIMLPGMLEPGDVGPLNLELGHFNGVAILGQDSKLAIEAPEHFLEHCVHG